jgi:hypothetical protein
MLVMLIKNDGEDTPPLGSVGEIVGCCDDDRDLDPDELLVEFPRYPCPAGPETAWICPEHWLVPLDCETMEDGTYRQNRMYIISP